MIVATLFYPLPAKVAVVIDILIDSGSVCGVIRYVGIAVVIDTNIGYL